VRVPPFVPPFVPRFLRAAAVAALVAVPARDAGAAGEPDGDYPSYEERAALYATNRARVDPAGDGWASFAAVPPLQWNVDLDRAARAHSLDMRDTPCFQHPSCDGTDPFARIATYYTGPMSAAAENIAAGVADPFAVVESSWINEVGAAPGETGHRMNVFSSTLTLVGLGFAPGAMAGAPRGTTANYWTQDFIGTPVTYALMADGIHFPKSVASGGGVTFGTTCYAGGGAGPQAVYVVVDGMCTSLRVARGSASHGAYEVLANLPDGCHGYYFLAVAGSASTYPGTGSLQVGVGADAASCALYTDARDLGPCDPASGVVPTGAGGAPPTGGGGGGGCGCNLGDLGDLAPGGGARGGLLLAAGLALVVRRRRVVRGGQQAPSGQRPRAMASRTARRSRPPAGP